MSTTSKRVIFGSREALIHRTWNQLGLLKIARDYHVDYVSLDCKFTDEWFVQMFSATNRWSHDLFVFTKQDDRVLITPKILVDIDSKYVFTKFDEDESLSLTEAYVKYTKKQSAAIYQLTGRFDYIDTKYVSSGFEDMYRNVNNQSLFDGFVYYNAFKTLKELYEHQYIKIGAWDSTTYCDNDGWLVDARFNSRPAICKDESLFETRIRRSAAFECYIENIRLRDLDKCLIGLKP